MKNCTNQLLENLKNRKKYSTFKNKTKHLLVENKFKKNSDIDSSLLISESYFNNDGAQLFLIQLLYYTLKRLGDTEKVVS